MTRPLTCLPLLLAVSVAFPVIALVPQPAAAQEVYTLEVPGQPQLTSQAVRDRGRLTITDATGQTFVYQREPRFDTADGEYRAYFSQKAGQFIRWPADGTGAMLIGGAAGANWRPSQMRVRPRAVNPVPPRRPRIDRPVQVPPVTTRPDRTPRRNDRRVADRNRMSAMHLDVLPAGNNRYAAAYVNREGQLQLFEGAGQQWQPADVRVAEGLVPGAPIRLVNSPAGRGYGLYSIDDAGVFSEFAFGGQRRAFDVDTRFLPGTDFGLLEDGRFRLAAAVDDSGRLWDLDLNARRGELIEARTDRYLPGTPVVTVTGDRPALMLVDRTGSLVQYQLAGGRWVGPQWIADGYRAGGGIAAIDVPLGTGGGLIRHVAGVNREGHLQLLRYTGNQWQPERIGTDILTPGVPLQLTHHRGDLLVSAVNPQGIWQQWHRPFRGRWAARQIARGLPVGAPVVMAPGAPYAWGVDITGRLLAGELLRDSWECVLCVPGFERVPRLISRRVIQNRQLASRTVQFINSHTEPLITQVYNRLAPGQIEEFTIPPGQAVPRNLQFDGGGVLEEVFAVPGPGGWVERVEQYDLPAQQSYTVVVYADRVTYRYIDPRGADRPAGALPDFDRRNPVSLGVFDLPPAELLPEGARIDVYAEAAVRRNPGAAIHFAPPRLP